MAFTKILFSLNLLLLVSSRAYEESAGDENNQAFGLGNKDAASPGDNLEDFAQLRKSSEFELAAEEDDQHFAVGTK